MKKYKDVHVDCTLNTKNGKVHVDAILHVNQTLQSQKYNDKTKPNHPGGGEL